MDGDNAYFKRKRTIIKPTFADSPSFLLTNLSTKYQSRAQSHLSRVNVSPDQGSKELRRPQSEISIYYPHNDTPKNDNEVQRLIVQLSQIQQEIIPKVSNLEKQHSFSQIKIDEIKSRYQKDVIGEIGNLQKQYDQLYSKLDRFISIDAETKMKILDDDIRLTRSNLDGFAYLITTNLRKLKTELQSISNTVNTSFLEYSGQKGQFPESFDRLREKIGSLEKQMKQLKDIINDMPKNSVASKDLNQIGQLNRSIQNFGLTILPQQTKELNQEFLDSIEKVRINCDTNISKLEQASNEIIHSNNQINNHFKNEIENIKALQGYSNEIQNYISSFDRTKRSQLLNLRQDINSSFVSSRSQISDFRIQHDRSLRNVQNNVKADLNKSKMELKDIIQQIKQSINSSTIENREAQQEAAQQVAFIRNQLDGNGNALNRIRVIEDQISWCISTVSEINQRRAEYHTEGGSPMQILTRLEILENRLKDAEMRLSNLDNEEAPLPKKIEKNVETIEIPPSKAVSSQDNDQGYIKRAQKRKLPSIPPPFFIENEDQIQQLRIENNHNSVEMVPLQKNIVKLIDNQNDVEQSDNASNGVQKAGDTNELAEEGETLMPETVGNNSNSKETSVENSVPDIEVKENKTQEKEALKDTATIEKHEDESNENDVSQKQVRAEMNLQPEKEKAENVEEQGKDENQNKETSSSEISNNGTSLKKEAIENQDDSVKENATSTEKAEITENEINENEISQEKTPNQDNAQDNDDSPDKQAIENLGNENKTSPNPTLQENEDQSKENTEKVENETIENDASNDKDTIEDINTKPEKETTPEQNAETIQSQINQEKTIPGKEAQDKESTELGKDETQAEQDKGTAANEINEKETIKNTENQATKTKYHRKKQTQVSRVRIKKLPKLLGMKPHPMNHLKIKQHHKKRMKKRPPRL